MRAAQLLLEHDAPQAGGQGALHDATDAELLLIAKGGMPRIEGPRAPRAAAVPSRPRADRPALSADGEKGTQKRTREKQPAGGPKEDPPIPIAPGGPKTDPWNIKTPPPPKKDSVIDSENNVNNTPDIREPNPWE